jgi:hypothetical protein
MLYKNNSKIEILKKVLFKNRITALHTEQPKQLYHLIMSTTSVLQITVNDLKCYGLDRTQTTRPCFKVRVSGTDQGTVEVLVPYGRYDTGDRHTNALIRRANSLNGTTQVNDLLAIHQFREAERVWKAKSWMRRLFSERPVYTGRLPLDYVPTPAENNALNHMMNPASWTSKVACEVVGTGRGNYWRGNYILAPGEMDALSAWSDWSSGDRAQERSRNGGYGDRPPAVRCPQISFYED